MKGSESRILNYLEGANNRYVVPVYQRRYSWKEENCRQLYEDLRKVVEERRESHFFGSLVTAVDGAGATTEYRVIDGQQRLTTVTLLLLAIRNLVRQGKVPPPEDPSLAEQINELYLVSKWAKEDDRIKLRLTKDDQEALRRLFDADEDLDPSSKLTLNYQLFCNLILREEVTVEQLFDALKRLEIISITLERDDDAQLIFESLNSTGLALEEGDKIRNLVLMGLSPSKQDRYYTRYWTKIEACTAGDVSGFVRDYLSAKQQVQPRKDAVYQAFKAYMRESEEPVETLLEDLLRYARLYRILLTCESGFEGNTTRRQMDDCLYRLRRLDIVVTRPFFLEVLRLCEDGRISQEDALQVFRITESYLFRRNVCDVATNSLNKIFLNLNREILRYDNTAHRYVDKLVYALRSKRDSSRFPNDAEFKQAIATKQVYQMRPAWKAYLLERLENHGTVETKDVYAHLDNGDYTIEHIMPQHLTPTWTASLGRRAAEIHETWLHRLANLTLTGYNPKLSNRSFQEKRDAPEGGYRASGLRMNQEISQKRRWGLPELEERSEALSSRALLIWELPRTDFVPARKELDSCTLDDESFDLTGLDLAKYSYQGMEQPAASWTDMFEHVVRFLHERDRSVLCGLAQDEDGDNVLSRYVGPDEGALRNALRIDEGVYVETNTNTALKASILRRLFPLYDADPMDLVFYLKDPEGEKEASAKRDQTRLRYWAFALPEIRRRNAVLGAFGSTKPSASNRLSGALEVRGLRIDCLANRDQARVELVMSSGDAKRDQAAFDALCAHRGEIEGELGVSLAWERGDKRGHPSVGLALPDVGVDDEGDWPRMARFHAQYSERIGTVAVPYLQETEGDAVRLALAAMLIREWAISREGVNEDLAHSSRACARFTTDAMSAILPDLKDAPSSWGTNNHYFYEIKNTTGAGASMSLVVNSQNATDELMGVFERIQALYPARSRSAKPQWTWRTHFKASFAFDADLSKDEVFAGLDRCLAEMRRFEEELAKELGDLPWGEA